MKKIVILICYLCFNLVNAQDTTVLNLQRHHFIKYNFGPFLNMGAAIHYEYVFKDFKSIQIGYTHSILGVFFPDWKYRTINTDLKLPIKIRKRQIFYSGVSARWLYNHEAIDYDDHLTPIFETLNHYGIGGIIGLEFFLSKKNNLILDFSTSIGYQYVDKKSKYEYYFFPVGQPLFYRIAICIGYGLR